ncbi:MAG: hypothetical protein QME49_01720 [bacterium]|nr:hypothetical protein [bacterium]
MQKNKMSKNWVESLYEALAYIGGAGITASLIRQFSKPYYVCPSCGLEVYRGSHYCLNCMAKLLWKI